MNKPTNPIAAVNHCPAGERLPSDWQQKAKMRAKMANAHYLFELQNAWRGNPNAIDPNTARQARLSAPSNAIQWKDVLGEK